MNVIAFHHVVLSCQLAANSGVPPALELVLQQRSALHTGLIDFRHWHGSPAAEYRFRARIAGEDSTLENRGDVNGELSGRTVRTNPADDEVWYVSNLYTPALVWENGCYGVFGANAKERDGLNFAPWSYRSLGLSFDSLAGDPDTLLSTILGNQSAHFEEGQADEVYIVSATTPDRRVEWHLDPERGWNPVRVRLIQEGEIQGESVTRLQKVGGEWYAQSVEFFGVGGEPGRTKTQQFVLDSVEFNRPEHPTSLTPNDIGVEVGANVDWRFAGGSQTVLFWDGRSAIPQEEFQEKLRNGEVKYSSRGQAQIAKFDEQQHTPAHQRALLQAIALSPAPVESEWEAYTRLFIQRYKLDREQEAAAFRILRDCQQQAQGYVRKVKPEFEMIEKRRAELIAMDNLPEDAMHEIAQASRKLMGPLDQVFEDHLKPRLAKIPTTKQRAAFEVQADRR